MTPDTQRPAPGPHGSDPFGGLPRYLRNVPYSGARHPGTPSPDGPSSPGGPPQGRPRPPAQDPAAAVPDLSEGANCQRYAYAVLRHHGLAVPPLRSSDLWADTGATLRTERPGPLDLVLFDGGPVPGRPPGYGAHVGVHLGPDRVLHLCREVGRPAVWRYADFAARPRYARLLGFKRPLLKVTDRAGAPQE